MHLSLDHLVLDVAPVMTLLLLSCYCDEDGMGKLPCKATPSRVPGLVTLFSIRSLLLAPTA